MGFWLLIVSTMMIFVLLAFVALPKMLKQRYKEYPPYDIGLNRMDLDKRSAVLFEPVGELKKYIEKYIVQKEGDTLSLLIKGQENIKHLCIDLLSFDKNHKVIELENIEVDINDSKNISDLIELPNTTSYISLVVLEVNNDRVESEVKRVDTSKYEKLYALLETILVTGLLVFYRYLFSSHFADEYVMNSFNDIPIWVYILVFFINYILVYSGVKRRR